MEILNIGIKIRSEEFNEKNIKDIRTAIRKSLHEKGYTEFLLCEQKEEEGKK